MTLASTWPVYNVHAIVCTLSSYRKRKLMKYTTIFSYWQEIISKNLTFVLAGSLENSWYIIGLPHWAWGTYFGGC